MQECLINQRGYTTILPLQAEFTFQANENYLFPLAYLASLCVAGERGRDFLQGQLSCDVREVTDTTMRQGALCNLQGRVLSLLDVLDWQGLQLILPKDLVSATQHSLAKVAMLSKVSLTMTNSYQIYGLYLNNSSHLPCGLNVLQKLSILSTEGTENWCGYYLGNNLYVLLVHNKNTADELLRWFQNTQQLRGSLAWHYLQLQHKHLQIYPETRGLFLPHRLNLHLTGHISFDKGCYKGQEIIARTHYRAKPKHALHLFTVQTKTRLEAGQKLMDPVSNGEIGELIDFSPLPEQDTYLIAASTLFQYPAVVYLDQPTNIVHLNHDPCCDIGA